MAKGVNYIALAIPFFFLLIGLELAVARWKGRSVYRLADTLSDLACGVLQQFFGVFITVLTIGAYVVLYEQARLTTLPTDTAWSWVLLFFGVDFLYYWFHRLSHQVNLLWGAHVVHHQSEEYNLAVALRQAAFQPAFSWVFYLPLAVLGFPPLMFGAMLSLNVLYQFWIHTRLIGRLGPLEWLLNTPSHHRVHHGRNPKYIDKNHGGTLIIWDMLFGTFQREEEEPVYGVTFAFRSWNPLWANFHYYAELWRQAKSADRWQDALQLWLKPPGWMPKGVEAPPHAPLDLPKYDTEVSRGLSVYAVLQFAPLVPGTALFLQQARELGAAGRVGAALLGLFTLVSIGALLERRAFAARLEVGRLLFVALVSAVGFSTGRLPFEVAAGIVVFTGVSLAGLLRNTSPRPEVSPITWHR